MSFFRRSPSALGIDIGTTSVKIVELQKNGERAILKNYGEYQQSSSKEGLTSIGTGFLAFSEDKISNIIQGILKEAKIETKKANFSLPVFSSFSTVIELPLMAPEEIAGTIRFQSHQYVPVPIEEVVLDWNIIEEEEALFENKIKVFLVAIPKDVIEKYGKIGEKVGLTIKNLELESFAQVRALMGEDKSPVLILDIGGRTTSITIVDRGFIRLCHSLDFSILYSLAKDLSQRLNISFERAEILCKEKGLKKETSEIAIVAPSLTPIVDKLIFEIEKAMNNYLLNNPQREIKKIILLGGGSLMPGVSEYLSTKLNKETIIGNPFLKVDYPPVLTDVLKEIGPGFATAIGLALKEFEKNK